MNNKYYQPVFVFFFFMVSRQRERWRFFLTPSIYSESDLAYQSCVFYFNCFLFRFTYCLNSSTHLSGRSNDSRIQEFIGEGLEPLPLSIDEVRKSIATANSNYDQLLTKMSTYEKWMTKLVQNENKRLKLSSWII